MALAHDERDQTEGAYSRTDFLEKRRPLMQDWAEHASSEKTVETEMPSLADAIASPTSLL